MAASVRNAIHALSDAAKDLAPVPLDGDWTLLWTDAPDITGLGSSLPFAPTLGRIGQEISAADGTVVNVIEWRPASLLTTLRSELSEDSVEQRVVTGFTEATPGDVKLVLKGAGLRPRRVLNRDLSWALTTRPVCFRCPSGIQGPPQRRPLRVVKTGQNFYSVNERLLRQVSFVNGQSSLGRRRRGLRCARSPLRPASTPSTSQSSCVSISWPAALAGSATASARAASSASFAGPPSPLVVRRVHDHHLRPVADAGGLER